MNRSFVETAFETLEDRQLMSMTIPTTHAVAMHHSSGVLVSVRRSSIPLRGVTPIIHPTPPFRGVGDTGGGGLGTGGGTGTGGDGGGIINHPGPTLLHLPRIIS